MIKKMYCKICERETRHRYIGEQKFHDKTHHLWNCAVCGGTRAANRK